MSVAWIEHRFTGGALALDVANTVVLRIDPDRTFDRFDDNRELARFAEAASRYRHDELSEQRLLAAGEERSRMISLRESIDALFREAVVAGELRADKLREFLSQSAAALRDADASTTLAPGSSGPLRLATATALSAIALLAPDQWRRIRICDNCGWLFLDRSKNRSRRWCDMAVCGNRTKARRHYERRKEQP